MSRELTGRYRIRESIIPKIFKFQVECIVNSKKVWVRAKYDDLVELDMMGVRQHDNFRKKHNFVTGKFDIREGQLFGFNIDVEVYTETLVWGVKPTTEYDTYWRNATETDISNLGLMGMNESTSKTFLNKKL